MKIMLEQVLCDIFDLEDTLKSVRNKVVFKSKRKPMGIVL